MVAAHDNRNGSIVKLLTWKNSQWHRRRCIADLMLQRLDFWAAQLVTHWSHCALSPRTKHLVSIKGTTLAASRTCLWHYNWRNARCADCRNLADRAHWHWRGNTLPCY